MSRILNAFLANQLNLDGMVLEKNPEHQRILAETKTNRLGLYKRLDTAEKELLDDFVSSMETERYYYGQSKLLQGFLLGSLMMIEIFQELSTFLHQETVESENA